MNEWWALFYNGNICIIALLIFLCWCGYRIYKLLSADMEQRREYKPMKRPASKQREYNYQPLEELMAIEDLTVELPKVKAGK